MLAAIAVSAGMSAAVATEIQLPRQMAWSAYNLGSTGYNQAVAIGKVLKQHYGTTLRVLPGKNDVSRLLPLVKGRVQFSANGIATVFAQEGVFQFAERNWGPIPVRLVLTSNGDSNQSLAVAADTGVREFAQLKGKRVPWVRGAPALNVSTEAMLACAGLSWSDVERVEFSGYNAMWNGVVNGQVDAAYGTTVSGPTRKLEASPRGIFWPPLAHDDEGCWKRASAIAPYLTRHLATRGAAISADSPHEGATYPYPLLIALESTPDQLVTHLARAIIRHYDEHKDADPGSVGWALERQQLDWVVPFHSGAVAFFTEQGLWTPELESHNKQLLRRQAVLARAWAESGGRDAQSWLAARVSALEAEGFDPIWR